MPPVSGVEGAVAGPSGGQRVRCGPALLAALLWLVPAAPAAAATFTSCDDLRAYFTAPLPQDLREKQQDLERGMWLLQDQRGPQGCDDWIVERAHFELASARDELSRSPRGDPSAARHRAGQAAKTYEEYLDWFLGLSDDRQDRLIRTVTKSQQATPAAFKAARRKWLRSRVGGVLQSLGASLVRAGAHAEVLAAYDRYFRESIEIFPTQVVRSWHRWLRAMPDFAAVKGDREVRALIVADADARSHWGVFAEFLEAFIPANPSAARDWAPVRRKVERWLRQAS
jgi:hypothetical protein